MFFVVNIFLLVIGVLTIFLGELFVKTVIAKDPKRRFQGFPNLPFIRVVQFVGLTLLIFGLGVFKHDIWPWYTLMGKDENRLALLENGAITEGQVVKVYYQRAAPEGWRLDYNFLAEDPGTQENRIYVGSARGPKKYYASLSVGDPVTVIYLLVKPEVNCEIRYFLNNPSYRRTFEKAGKSELLGKFENQYDIDDYSFKEWFKLQWQK